MSEVIYESHEVVTVTVRMTKEGAERRDKLLAEGKCLGCERKLKEDDTVRLGLEDTCYQAALRAIKARKTTKSELIRNGKMLPRRKGGRPATNKFTQELAQL